MPDPECRLSELPASQCACPRHRGGHAPGDEPVETVGQPFAAMFPGPCARGCAGIQAGDQIARVAESGQGYVHAGRCSR